jgi:hypothetical protein
VIKHLFGSSNCSMLNSGQVVDQRVPDLSEPLAVLFTQSDIFAKPSQFICTVHPKVTEHSVDKNNPQQS